MRCRPEHRINAEFAHFVNKHDKVRHADQFPSTVRLSPSGASVAAVSAWSATPRWYRRVTSR